MIQSMTGFASKSIILSTPQGEKSTVTMNLKTLNSRFFESTIRLPAALTHFETKLTKLFKQKLRRGHVYFTIYLSNPSIFQGTITPALAAAEAYESAMKKIMQHLNIKQDIALEHFLRLPNLFSIEAALIDEQSTQTLMQAINELIEAVISVRNQEGTTLAKDIEQRAAIMQREIDIIEKQAAQFIQQHKEKVHKTLQEIGADKSLLAEAQKNALYTMLDKIDIHEEIIRFKSHLEQFNKHLKSPSIEKGKQLDFILQEFAREINTIAAKCSHATISSHAINVKVEIEKTREQVQNIV